MFMLSKEMNKVENVTYYARTVKESSLKAQLQDAQMLRPGGTVCPHHPIASVSIGLQHSSKEAMKQGLGPWLPPGPALLK